MYFYYNKTRYKLVSNLYKKSPFFKQFFINSIIFFQKIRGDLDLQHPLKQSKTFHFFFYLFLYFNKKKELNSKETVLILNKTELYIVTAGRIRRVLPPYSI